MAGRILSKYELTISEESHNYWNLDKHSEVRAEVRRALTPKQDLLIDEYMDADYDKKHGLLTGGRSKDFKAVEEAYEAVSREGGQLHDLRLEFGDKAPPEWWLEMTRWGYLFAGSEGATQGLLEYLRRTQGSLPEVDYRQQYQEMLPQGVGIR